ncbi:MAG: RIP metalloprotease RseP, partial [Gammaproteobacteria bacterium]
MDSFLHTVFYFIVSIGVLVSFHEFGHFWVARKVGVKVIRFSVGFGKIFWRYQKKPGETEYVLSAIPLGGYVKMVDEREGPVNKEDLPFAFNRQPLLSRTAVVAAGPVFNLLLAVVLYWFVFVIGDVGIRPMIDAVDEGTFAAQAGFEERDQITDIDGKDTPTWSEAMGAIFSAALGGEKRIKVGVATMEGERHTRTLFFPDDIEKDPEVFYRRLGLKLWSPKLDPVIGKVLEGSAAEKAGLMVGDRIVSADGEPVERWMQLVERVQKKAGVPIELIVERDGVQFPLEITPMLVDTEQGVQGKIGAAVEFPENLIESMRVEYRLPPLAALLAAFDKTFVFSLATLKMMGHMLVGNASVENLSGPISIAQYAGQSAEMGFVHFLKFLAIVSVSLGVLNL